MSHLVLTESCRDAMRECLLKSRRAKEAYDLLQVKDGAYGQALLALSLAHAAAADVYGTVLDAGDECSICRGVHGPEIRHACE